MKKASIFAAAAITIAATGFFTQSANAYEWRDIRVTDDYLYYALNPANHLAKISLSPSGGISFLDKGYIYMGTPFDTGVIRLVGDVTDIEMDCSNGDPLANVTDFSALSSLGNLRLGVCTNGYQAKVPSNVTVVTEKCSTTIKHVVDDTVIKENVIEGFCQGLSSTPNVIETLPSDSYNLTGGSYKGDVTTFVFRYGNADGESMRTNVKDDDADADVIGEYFSDYYDFQPLATWNDLTSKTITYNYERIARNIPAGNYNVPLDDYNENGELSKLRDENGNETEFTIGDIIAIVDTLDEGAVNEIIATASYSFISFNTEGGPITVTIGEKPADAAEPTDETNETDETENPNTIDSLGAILITTVASATILGFGIASKTRRR